MQALGDPPRDGIARLAVGAQQPIRQGVVGPQPQHAQRVVAVLDRWDAKVDGGLDRVEAQVQVQLLLAGEDHRVGQIGAEHDRCAHVVLLAELAGRRGRSRTAVDAQLKARAAEERLERGLAERLTVGEGVIDLQLGLLAVFAEAVEVGDAERLDRAGVDEGAVVDGGEQRYRLAADLGDQGQRARVVGRGLQHRVHGDPGHLLRQQQVAFQRRRIDRPLLGQMVQEAQHLDAGRADVAVELDAGDASLGDNEAQLAGGHIEVDRYGGQHVAVSPVVPQDRQARGVDLGQRGGRADQPRGQHRDLGLRIGGDALDRHRGDTHRPVGHLGSWCRQRQRRAAGRDGRWRLGQDTRDRRALRHRRGGGLRAGRGGHGGGREQRRGADQPQ